MPKLTVVSGIVVLLAMSSAATAQSLRFNRTDYLSGSGANSIVTGHFNRDRHLDMAVANREGNSVSVFLGRGSGRFARARTFATGTDPRAIRAADVNNDGNLDLITANTNGGSVSLLLGTGRGSFRRVDVPACESCLPLALEPGDFNGDRNIDIALLFVGSNQIGMLLGHGDGTFDLNETAGAVRDDPQWLEAGDFNRDGRLDLATANFDFIALSTAQGNGDGTFRTGPEYSTGWSSVSLDVADLNGDRILDIVVANVRRDGPAEHPNTASVFLGDGTGNFALATELETGKRPVSVVTADFNGDGRRDVAVANAESGNPETGPALATVTIYLGNGDGTFSARQELITTPYPARIATADFNRDRRSDLAVTYQSHSVVSLFLSVRPR